MSKFYLSGRNQTKVVTATRSSQIIQPDVGYNALASVVVNPDSRILDLENYVMRDENADEFSLYLNGDVPIYACYRQKKLVSVSGEPTSVAARAFEDCAFLASIDLSEAVSIGSYAFSGCTSLTGGTDLSKAASIGSYAFHGCALLEGNVDCRSATSIGDFAFDGCGNIVSLDVRNLHSLSSRMCNNCSKLKYVDFRNASSVSNQYVFANSALYLLDLSIKSGVVIPLSSVASVVFGTIPFTILVADAETKAMYQSATNWSGIASRFKTVTEFEQEIGVSYDAYYLEHFGHPRFDVQEAQS